MKLTTLRRCTWSPHNFHHSFGSYNRNNFPIASSSMHIVVEPPRYTDLLDGDPEFINDVFSTMNEATRHEFYVTTRYPDRLGKIFTESLHEHIWIGILIDGINTNRRLEELYSAPVETRFAHFLPTTKLPRMEASDLDFVTVIAPREPVGMRKLERACEDAGTPLFYGQRLADAQLCFKRMSACARAARYPSNNTHG